MFLLVACVSWAQDKSNKGKEFWLGYGHNILFTADNPVNAQELVLYLSAEQAATVTVTVNGTSFSQTVSIPAGSVDVSITIPKTGANDARLTAEGLSTKGIHVLSDVPIVAYAHEYGLLSSGATMLMPVDTYGYTYYSLNYTQNSNYPNCYSWFYVVAAEDNTKLFITPADTTQGGWLPTQTYIVTLNKGQIYNVFGKTTSTYAGKDMSGSKVVSVAGADGNCHPVAVFSGSSRNDLLSPNCSYNYVSGGNNYTVSGNGGEFMMQQIFPANAWGTKYVTYHPINNTSNNLIAPYYTIYRVAVRNPSTIIKRNGTVITGIVKNFYYEFTSTTGDVIEADQPILVAQYTTSTNQCNGSSNNPFGDPEMIYLSPIEQGVKSAIFYNTRKQDVSLNYVNIIVPAVSVASMQIDGTSIDPLEFIPHPANSNYAFVARRLYTASQHTIICDSTFIATVYGTGTLESYGYNVGTLVNNLNAIGIIKNTYNANGKADTFTCPKTPVRLFIKLAYRATNIIWKFSQVNVGGINVDSIVNNPVPLDSNLVNGRKYYTYTLQQDFVFNIIGTHYIPVSYTAPDIDNCSQTETTTLKVVVKAGPSANFSFTSPLCVKQDIQFTGSATANGFNLISYQWDFDGVVSASSLNTARPFAIDGTHDAKFIVRADNGCSGDSTKTITIVKGPTVTIAVSGKPCVDSSLLLTSSFAYDSNTPTNWFWEFGDGQSTNISTSNTATHAYTSATNNIVVRHAVNIIQGCKGDTTTTVIPFIKANPVASFSIVGDTLCINKPLQFTAPSNPSITQWQWNFGDSNGTNIPPFSKAYNSAGIYSPTLKLFTSEGCGSLLATNNISIASPPLISAGADKFVNLGSSIMLDGHIANASNYTYLWNPSSTLDASNILTPIATPMVTTMYAITAHDIINHCMATDSVLVTIITKIVVPNAFTPNNDGINDTWQIPTLASYAQAVVEVYNRGGQIVFKSTHGYQQPWNGMHNDNPLPIGTYYYIINPGNGTSLQSGSVTILK